jgi:hypothetical protein
MTQKQRTNFYGNLIAEKQLQKSVSEKYQKALSLCYQPKKAL